MFILKNYNTTVYQQLSLNSVIYTTSDTQQAHGTWKFIEQSNFSNYWKTLHFFFQSSIHSNIKYKWNSEKTILISKYLLGHTLINILMVKNGLYA